MLPSRHLHGPIEANLRAAMAAFGNSRPGGEAVSLGGIQVVFAGVDLSVFNSALLEDPVRDSADFETRLSRAAQWFRARGAPWSFWICEQLLPDAVRWQVGGILQRYGLRFLTMNPGMYAEALRAPRHLPPELEFRPVGDPATRTAFCHLMSVAFEGPFQTLLQVYDTAAFWQAAFRGWIGYSKGQAVCTAATVTAAGVVGVYAVATLPNFRRRGYGEHVTRHALRKAAEESGLIRSVLQSTAAGLSMYEQMGYRRVTNFQVFSSH